jgi:hypothetical protein
MIGKPMALPSGALGLGKLGDVVAGVLECDELAPAGQIDRIVERSLPAARPAFTPPPYLPRRHHARQFSMHHQVMAAAALSPRPRVLASKRLAPPRWSGPPAYDLVRKAVDVVGARHRL